MCPCKLPEGLHSNGHNDQDACIVNEIALRTISVPLVCYHILNRCAAHADEYEDPTSPPYFDELVKP